MNDKSRADFFLYVTIWLLKIHRWGWHHGKTQGINKYSDSTETFVSNSVQWEVDSSTMFVISVAILFNVFRLFTFSANLHVLVFCLPLFDGVIYSYPNLNFFCLFNAKFSNFSNIWHFSFSCLGHKCRSHSHYH